MKNFLNINIFILFLIIRSDFLFGEIVWRTAIYSDDNWFYLVPEIEPDEDWNMLVYDASNWTIGQGGFGYGDGDDGTTIDQTISVYLRKSFSVENISLFQEAILHADYDDGFIAYLNGHEVARSSNLGNQGDFISYNTTTSADHEASLYNGVYPDTYILDSEILDSLLLSGENVLAIQVHNVGISSSDLSSNFFLSFSFDNNSSYFRPVPDWFVPPFNFSVSNLPIININTYNQEIISETRIIAHMGIINNSNGINNLADSFNDYDGRISIEIRGSSSQMFPKKQYALETQDSDGNNNNISVLGLPEENDWILYAPYSDKSLIRNYLAYKLARDMGAYSSRTRFCELVIDGDYKGIYLFMEKIKRDDSRIDISKLEPNETSGDDLTGGYIIKVDKWNGEDNNGWYTESPNDPSTGFYYQYHYPKPDEIVSQQEEYIRAYFSDFESLLLSEDYNNPDLGYYRYIDIGSFIDVSIVSEISKNVDAYRLSAYMYKNKNSVDSLLYMGPIWDYNLAFGNADYYSGWDINGWQVKNDIPENDNFRIPFYWQIIWDDQIFRDLYYQRWTSLRQTVLSIDSIYNAIDSSVSLIEEAQERNFQRWPILNEYIWPNAFVGGNYYSEINYLKNWIRDRIDWIDQQFLEVRGGKILSLSYTLNEPFPNPFNPTTHLGFILSKDEVVDVSIYDISGSLVRDIYKGRKSAGYNSVMWDATDYQTKRVPSGVYFFIVNVGALNQSKKIILLK